VVDFGAYYYPWYDAAQWEHSGFIHTPLLGLYNSSDPKAIVQHIEWSKQHGINFFAVSWTGKEGPDKTPEKSDQNLSNQLLPNALSSDFKLAILYESTARLPPDANGSINLDTPGYADRLVGDLKDAAEYFDQPCYMKIDANGKSKPLVILYRARSFIGKVAETIHSVRDAIDDVYLVGDEVYWGGIIKPRLRIGSPKLKDPERVKLYDGVTPYNMHINNPKILADFENKLNGEYSDWYKTLSAVNVDFIPNVIPGYDDRKVPNRSNLPLTRGPERFGKQLDVAMKYASMRNIVLITSFNEWHEDTQIEPAEDYESPTAPLSFLELLDSRRILL